MKSILLKLRLSLALASVLVLGACGGGGLTSGYTALPVMGTISNLNYDGLILLDNGSDAIAPPAASVVNTTTTFSFPNQIKIGSTYTVSIGAQPLHQTCTISNPTDKAGRTISITVVITCAQNTYTVSGSVAGLTVDGLTLTNGADFLNVAANASTYTMPTAVADVATYGVTVWNNPPGLNCSVINGTGTMNGANVTTANVTCVPAT